MRFLFYFRLSSYLLIGSGFFALMATGAYGMFAALIFLLILIIDVPAVLGVRHVRQFFQQGHQTRVIIIYILIIAGYMVGSGFFFFSLDNAQSGSFVLGGATADIGHYIYYSIITFCTVGFGDMFPVTWAARIAVIIEIVVAAVLLIMFMAIIVLYLTAGDAELEEELLRIVDEELGERCRMIFLLSRAGGKTNREIADMLQVKMKTVENQLTHALKVLRKRLGLRRRES